MATTEALVHRLWTVGNAGALPDRSYYRVVGEALGSIAQVMPTAVLEKINKTPGFPTLLSLLQLLEKANVQLNSECESVTAIDVGKELFNGLADMPDSLAVVLPFLCR